MVTKPKSKPAAKVSKGGASKNTNVASNINNTSSYIQWQVIRNNSCFLKRQRGIPKLFSTERFNVRGVNSVRFNGLVNKTAVDIQPSAKGVAVTIKKKKNVAHPAKSTQSVNLVKSSRQTLSSLTSMLQGYKPAHCKAGRRRASQILRSLKPVKPAGIRKRGAEAGSGGIGLRQASTISDYHFHRNGHQFLIQGDSVDQQHYQHFFQQHHQQSMEPPAVTSCSVNNSNPLGLSMLGMGSGLGQQQQHSLASSNSNKRSDNMAVVDFLHIEPQLNFNAGNSSTNRSHFEELPENFLETISHSRVEE
uniref:Large ribosomal subunit protein eL28 n=1 Tax=Ditylenchus dipsaci TaxID=166011 RepID=A0A915DMS8_9BILA